MVLILPITFDLSCPKPCETGSVSPCNQGLLQDDGVCIPINPKCPKCAAYGLYKPPFTQCCMSSDDCHTPEGCDGECVYKDSIVANSNGQNVELERPRGCNYAIRDDNFCISGQCYLGNCMDDGTCDPAIVLPCDDQDICTVGDTCDTGFPDNCKPGTNECHGSGATYSFPQSAFCKNCPKLDHDNDGLIDQAEFLLADYFKPVLHFDSHENATLDYEPVTLYEATKWSDQWVYIVYALLFHRDGGYLCVTSYGGGLTCWGTDGHPCDSEHIAVMLHTKDQGKIFTLDWYTLSENVDYDSNSIFGGASPETLSDNSVHPVTYFSGGKHHQYSGAYGCSPSTYSHHNCYDTEDGKGPTKLPDLQSIKRYCMHSCPEGIPQYGNNVGEATLKQYKPYFINDLSKFFSGQTVWGSDRDHRPTNFLSKECTAVYKFFTKQDQKEIWESAAFPGGLSGTSTTVMYDDDRILAMSLPQDGTLRYAFTPTQQTPYPWPTGMISVPCASDIGIAAARLNGKLYVFCVNQTLSYFSTTNIQELKNDTVWPKPIDIKNDITNTSGLVAQTWNGKLFVVFYSNGGLRYVFSDNGWRWEHSFGDVDYLLHRVFVPQDSFVTYDLFTYKDRLYLAYYTNEVSDSQIKFYYLECEGDPWKYDGSLSFDIKDIPLLGFNTHFDAIYGLGLGYVKDHLYMGFVSGSAPKKTDDGNIRWIWALGCNKDGIGCNDWHEVHEVPTRTSAPIKMHFYPNPYPVQDNTDSYLNPNDMVWTGTDTFNESGTDTVPFIGTRRFWR